METSHRHRDRRQRNHAANLKTTLWHADGIGLGSNSGDTILIVVKVICSILSFIRSFPRSLQPFSFFFITIEALIVPMPPQV